jgi:hypothetical protein
MPIKPRKAEKPRPVSTRIIVATEDGGYLRRYFPDLQLLTPDPSK